MNKLPGGYVRPLVFYGSEKMGVSPVGARVHVSIAAWPWGAYLGEEGLAKGIRVKTSSFARHHVNVTMARAKVATTYANSILANLEATQDGYDEGLLLDTDGFVAEGCGENIFIVKDGRLYTPQLTTALDGITWRSVQQICADLGLRSRRRASPATTSISPTRRSSPAPRRKSRPSASSTGARSAAARAARSPRGSSRPSSTS